MSAGSVLANTIGDNPAEETSLTVPLGIVLLGDFPVSAL